MPSELSNVGVKKHACEAKLGLIEYPTTHASKADKDEKMQTIFAATL